jgi:hypothetical protein
LTPAALARLSGHDLAIPDIRCETDLVIAERAAALFPPLGTADGWDAHFGRELNATDDRREFGPPGHGWPVLEGKRIAPFAVDARSARWSIRPSRARALLGGARFVHAWPIATSRAPAIS